MTLGLIRCHGGASLEQPPTPPCPPCTLTHLTLSAQIGNTCLCRPLACVHSHYCCLLLPRCASPDSHTLLCWQPVFRHLILEHAGLGRTPFCSLPLESVTVSSSTRYVRMLECYSLQWGVGVGATALLTSASQCAGLRGVRVEYGSSWEHRTNVN